MGAVNPRQQLIAIDGLMQQHQAEINRTMDTARKRNGGVLSPSDAVRLAVATVESATMALYWLNVAAPLTKVPPTTQSRRDLSKAQSNKRRQHALHFIDERCSRAEQTILGLEEIARTEGLRSEAIDNTFAHLRLTMLCCRIGGRLYAGTSGGRLRVPAATLRTTLADLDAVRLGPDFPRRDRAYKQNLWEITTQVCAALGDIARVRAALSERRAVTIDPASRTRLLHDMIGMAEGEEAILARLIELKSLGLGTDLGPLFSRERVGRLSVLRDIFWWGTASINVDSAFAAPTIDEAFGCYDTWVYGHSAPPHEEVVQLACDWQGRGRAKWHDQGDERVESFNLDSSLAARFYYSMENMRPADRGVMRDVIRYLDTAIAPLLKRAIADKAVVRLQVGGLIAELPILMTKLDGVPLGGDPRIAYRHPNTSVHARDVDITPFELLVLDDCFGAASRRVSRVLQEASDNGPSEIQVLAFNSDEADSALRHDQLIGAMESCRAAILFCHCDSPVTIAGATAIVTGQQTRFQVEALSTLDLRALDELIIIGCSSGRPNPFVGDITLAHAAANAGVSQVVYSMWPLHADRAAEFVVALTQARSNGISTADFIASRYRDDATRAGSFVVMRPR